MNEILRILSNSVFIAGQRLINAVLQFLLFLLLVHSLSAEQLSLFELGRAALEIGVGIVVPGLAIIVLRESAKNRDWWGLHYTAIHKILYRASWIAAGVILILINIENFSLDKLLITGFFCLSIYYQSTCTTYEYFFIAQDQVRWSMTVNILCNVIIVGIAILIALFFPHPAIGVSLLLFFRWWINHILYTRRVKASATGPVPLPRSSSDPQILRLFRDSFPLTLGSVFFILYARIDTIMLEWLGREDSIAFYSASYRLVGLLSMLFLSIYQALSPTISRRIGESYRHSFFFVFRIGIGLGSIGLLLLFILQISGGFLISFLYPDTYQSTVAGLKVLAWTLPIIFMGNAFGYFLINETFRGPKYYAAINFFGLAVNIIGNWIFIPQFDYLGAAWVTVLTDAVTTLLMLASTAYICRVAIPSVSQLSEFNK